MNPRQPISLSRFPDRRNSGSINTVLVYNPINGKIVHTHQFSISGPIDPPSDEYMERKALQFIDARGVGVEDFEVLHLRKAQLKRHTNYRIDATTRRLVEEPTNV